jgi:hypothetical protein
VGARVLAEQILRVAILSLAVVVLDAPERSVHWTRVGQVRDAESALVLPVSGQRLTNQTETVTTCVIQIQTSTRQPIGCFVQMDAVSSDRLLQK